MPGGTDEQAGPEMGPWLAGRTIEAHHAGPCPQCVDGRCPVLDAAERILDGPQDGIPHRWTETRQRH